MASLVDRWTNLGSRPEDTPAAARAAAFANVLAVVVTMGGMLMAVTLAVVDKGLALATLALAPLYLVPFALLHARHRNAARLYMTLFHNLVALVFTYRIGAGPGPQLLTFFTIGTPIMLFDRDARGYMVAGVLSSLAAFFVPVWFPHLFAEVMPRLTVDPGVAPLLRTTSALLTFGVILFELLFLRGQFERSERRLRDCVDNTGQLLKIACHDMASPLAVLNTALEIREKELEGRAPDRVHLVLKKTSLRIQALLTVIRKLHAVEDAKVDLKPVPLDRAVRAAVEAMEDVLEAKRILLDTDGLAHGLEVMGDWTIMTESILVNVLSNAVKFSPRGSAVRVTAEASRQGVVLSVVDHGVGMTAEAVHGVTRGEVLPSRPGTEGETGSGFGLTLVRAFMGKLGGQLLIESVPPGAATLGAGTTVRLVFQACGR